MRPIYGRLTAAGNGPWIPVNRLQADFKLALAGSIDSGSVLEWEVQHTLSDLSAERNVVITRVTTTATVADTAHGLKVGDSVIIRGSGDANLNGTYAVASVVNADSYTYTVVDTGAAGPVWAVAKNLRVFDHATLTAQAGSADGNYSFPPSAIRFVITSYTSGALNYEVNQA
jgi:hypothetical protein